MFPTCKTGQHLVPWLPPFLFLPNQLQLQLQTLTRALIRLRCVRLHDGRAARATGHWHLARLPAVAGRRSALGGPARRSGAFGHCALVGVVYGLFNGLGDIFTQAAARPDLAALLRPEQGGAFSWAQWLGLMVLALCAALVLPRQFQVMVVENVEEDHVRRAAWMFPLYLLLINLFVLPIALGGLLIFTSGAQNPEHFVLSLPMAAGQNALALFVFVGGLSAATGMVIVETVAVSTMVSNELALPLLLRLRLLNATRQPGDFTAPLLLIRRAAIVGVLLLGYLYFQLAGDAYALASIGLISFAAVAQLAPALLGGMYWRGGTRATALAGLMTGAGVWVYTLMLTSLAK